MGCDIHGEAQRYSQGNWQGVIELDLNRSSYSLFGWLAGVRNYSGVTLHLDDELAFVPVLLDDGDDERLAEIRRDPPRLTLRQLLEMAHPAPKGHVLDQIVQCVRVHRRGVQ